MLALQDVRAVAVLLGKLERRLEEVHEQPRGAVQARHDVEQKILALSTYLGHAKVTDTYWYLTGVPELLEIASRRFERLAQPAQENAS